MSDEQNDDTVSVQAQAQAHVPGWFRSAVARFAPYVVGGMIGATGTGGVMYDAPTPDEIKVIVREAVSEELSPLREAIRDLQTRQTDLENRLIAHAERMKIYDKKLATRNR